MINEAIKKNGITYGIALGVILALITATMYSIDLKLFVSNWTGPSIFVINLVVGITLLVKTKKDLNGFFSFKDAFTAFSSFSSPIPKAFVTGLSFAESKTSVAPELLKFVKLVL